MKNLTALLVFFLLSMVGNAQTIFEYTEATNLEGTNLDADIRISVFEDRIVVIYTMPNTDFVEIMAKKEYKIIKYLGETGEDERGYIAFVWALENNLIFSHLFKTKSDNWSMLSTTQSEKQTVFQAPL